MRWQPLGEQLREIREERGLTLEDVEAQSRGIARAGKNLQYVITAGRLSQIENSYSVPSAHKFASLSEIYQVPYAELLQIYGIKPTGRKRVLD